MCGQVLTNLGGDNKCLEQNNLRENMRLLKN